MSSPLVTREVQRVRDLVRLAANDGAAEAEARTAALAACKLISKHGMIVLAHLPEPMIVERIVERAPEPRRATSYSPPPPPHPHGHRGRRVIRSRYASSCRVCGDPIEVGDLVSWVRGEGVSHPECGDEL